MLDFTGQTPANERERLKRTLGEEIPPHGLTPREARLLTRMPNPPERGKVLTGKAVAPGVRSPGDDEVDPNLHVRLHRTTLASALTPKEATQTLEQALTETRRQHRRALDDIHVALSVLMHIKTHQIWGAWAAAQGPPGPTDGRGKKRRKRPTHGSGKPTRGTWKNLPRVLHKMLRSEPQDP